MNKFFSSLLFLALLSSLSACGSVEDVPYDLSANEEGSAQEDCADDEFLTEDCVEFATSEGTSEDEADTEGSSEGEGTSE